MQAALHSRDPSTAPMWLLVLVTLSGTMAMHIFVPALPMAGSALGAAPAGMQQTITLYVVGLALGQLIYGPISDAWGRRPALLIGLVLYFGASVLALCAQTLPWLVAARLLQALGGAAGITLGRAIVRDIAPPERMVRDLALLNMLTLIGPGFSPVIGAYLADHFGWRSIYVFLICMGCAMILFTWRLLPETNHQRHPVAVAHIAAGYHSLLANPRYVLYALGGSCSAGTLYAYIATAPYIVHEQLGLPIRQVGWFAAATIAGLALGTLFTRKLIWRWAADRLLYTGAALALAMSLVFLLVQSMGWLTPTLLLLITVAMMFGGGMISPVVIARALGAAPALAGSASGFYGFGQMAMGQSAPCLSVLVTCPRFHARSRRSSSLRWH